LINTRARLDNAAAEHTSSFGRRHQDADGHTTSTLPEWSDPSRITTIVTYIRLKPLQSRELIANSIHASIAFVVHLVKLVINQVPLRERSQKWVAYKKATTLESNHEPAARDDN
jgi:hypothetical protein